jgi:hypothetical protein
MGELTAGRTVERLRPKVVDAILVNRIDDRQAARLQLNPGIEHTIGAEAWVQGFQL